MPATAQTTTQARPAPAPLRFVPLRSGDGGAAASNTEIEGLLVPFGGPYNGRDSYGTFFSLRTDFVLDWFTERPLLYHHGLDTDAGVSPVGRITAVELRADGLWMHATLDAESPYYTELRAMVEGGKIWLSSAAMAHLVQINTRTGEVLRWPLVEGSLTPEPSNPFAEVGLAAATRHYQLAGLPLDTLTRLPASATRAMWSQAYQDELPDSAFAYVDAEGARHLPYKNKAGNVDKAHVKDALSRLDETDMPDADKAKAKKKLMAAAKQVGVDSDDDDEKKEDAGRTAAALPAAPTPPMRADYRQGSFEQTISQLDEALNHRTPFSDYDSWTTILATYADRVLVCRYDYDDDGSERTYWAIPYTLSDEGELELGEPAQMEQQFTPVAEARAAVVPLTLDAMAALRHGQALLERTQDLQQRRAEEKRPLSITNQKALRAAAEALVGVGQAMSAFLTATEVQARDAAKVARLADPAYRRHQAELLRIACEVYTGAPAPATPPATDPVAAHA